ncbi:sister chromatid cohesion protein PDS5 homolog C-like isoform X4 [Rhodamnia argentea]|nr:sister chromatid cohesion protein PDS5 homolog C-like isoform X4 [Rhodamnia argentea]XP_048139499.1 sister chromatid cohesion protein PDS5 homolog C-like isoform X4 [Rhodamnia argentea]XP_048139500.1 sister chromatid cohesion protein PDS5 homolog C-like isoform X4 [Rhodamnia argentea]
MEQEPSDLLQDALLPLMKGLIAEALFKHSNEDVRVTVASCLSEILRIASPEQPYNDDQMKAIFQLIVEALSKLSQPSTRCYEKALSVLQTIARVKACLLMLDLECEALVVRMCLHFWFITRSNPSADAYWAVEQIMAVILTESEDISPDLLFPLLASVLKENEKVAPSCWKLGEKLISDCATKLRPILRGAMQSKGTTVDDYSPVVALICQNESATEHNHTNGSPKRGIADPGDSKGSILPREREPEPSSLMRTEEAWLYRESQTTKQPQNRRISVSRRNLTAVPTVSSGKRRTALKANMETVQDKAAVVLSDLRDKRMKLPIKGGSNTNKCTLEEAGALAGVLVGRRIKVWWPLDEMFYDGLIQSYDPIIKKHKVLYDDGDKETLNLEKERWEFIEDNLPEEEADNPKPITAPVILTKQRGSDKSSESMKILNYNEIVKRAGAATSLPEVEAPNFSNQNIGGDGSSNDDSNDGNVFEIRARSKDVQVENPSRSTSDDSTPEASLPRAISVLSKDVQLKKPRTSTSNESTPEGSPLRPMRAKSTDVRLSSTSNDSTLEASPPRPWGLWQSQSHRY